MPQGEIASTNELHVINTNFDISNIVPIEETQDRILKTLDSCAKILKEHCGPRSGYAMLLDDNESDMSFRPSQFTKDGISIMKAIRYVAPLERYIKNILTYIGDRVDRVAKDGTTTSMLLAAMLLSALLKDKKDVIPHDLSTNQVNNIIRYLFSTILDKFKDVTITLDELTTECKNEEEVLKIAGKIAYMQALSSSGGDHELAAAMKEIFESSPQATWEFIDYYQSGRETPERFTVEVDDFDAKIRCITGCSVPMNEGLGTEYREKDVTVILFPGPMMQQDFAAGEVMAYLEKMDPKKPILIMATMVDGMFTTRIQALNTKRDKPITIWQFAPLEQIAGQAYPWELMVLGAKCGITPVPFDKEFNGVIPAKHFFKADVHWKDTYMHFYNCIFKDGISTVLHPYYLHPKMATDFYNQSIERVKELISEYKEGHRPDGRMYSHFIQVLNDLACVKRPKLRVGGTSHDNLTSKHVVEDVQGAIMSSLNHGFVVNGIGSLIFALMLAEPEITNQIGSSASTVLNTCFRDLMNVATEIFYVVNEERFDDLKFSSKFEYFNHLYDDISSFFGYQGMMKIHTTDERDIELLTNGYPVMQPAKVTEELIKRIQELILKVVMTNKAIVFGGVMIREDQEEETCQ